MMLQIGDDGVVSKVDADDLIYVDKNELDEVIDRYTRLKEENDELKKELDQFYLLIGRGDWSGLVDLIKGDLE